MSEIQPLFPKSLHEVTFNYIIGGEGFDGEVYLDSVAVPTIGYGTALIVHGIKWDVLDNPPLKDRLLASGVKLDAVKFTEDIKTLIKIAEAHNNKQKAKKTKNVAKAAQCLAEIKKLFHEHTFSFAVDENQAKKLWKIGMDRDILPQLKIRLDSDGTQKKKKKGKKGTYEKLQGSGNEFVALADATYNAPGLISQELVGYIVQNERQKAFYYIGYKIRAHLNLKKNPGYITRSQNEASKFGYANGDQPTDTEIKELEQVYIEHKSEIDAYDKEQGPKLKKNLPGWQPFPELIKAAKQGKVIRWAPPAKHKKGTKKTGISPEQLSAMREYLLPQSLPQSTGLSSYEQIMKRYTGAGSDAPIKNINDPYQDIRDRYGDN